MVIECKNSKTGYKNTGAKEQCFFGIMIKTAVAVPGFSFADAEEAKDKTAWETAIAEKKIFPLYEVEELAAANTEPGVFEGRNQTYETSGGKKKSTYTSMLGICSYNSLKSFNKSTVQLFEFTEDGAIKGVEQEDGTIKGQDIVLGVGRFIDPSAEKPSYATITLNYKDYNQFEDRPAVVRPEGWGSTDIFGIFDVTLIQVSASATEIKFKVQLGCSGGDELLTSLLAADVVLKDLTGSTESVSFVAADADDIYTITGTGFADGFTLALDGVVTQTGISYESPEPLVIAVT